MKFEKECLINEPKEVIEKRLSNFFLEFGYKPCPGKLSTYTRGYNRIATVLFSLSPGDWNAKATCTIDEVNPENSLVKVILDVFTFGSLVLPSDKAYWKNETTEVEEAIKTGLVDRAKDLKLEGMAFNVRFGLLFLLAVGASVYAFFGLFIPFLRS